MLDLPAIKKLCEAAVEGPWESQPHQELAAAGNFFTRWDIITQQKRLVVKGIYGSDDADFIAQARTLVPQLVEALEEIREIAKEAGCNLPHPSGIPCGDCGSCSTLAILGESE